jgi:hypothetical protein
LINLKQIPKLLAKAPSKLGTCAGKLNVAYDWKSIGWTPELIGTLATGVLSFAGALGGVIVASRLEQANWNQRYTVEYRQKLIDKRVEILEKLVVLFNKTEHVQAMRKVIDLEQKSALFKSKCGLLGRQGSLELMAELGCDDAGYSFDRAERLAKEINSLSADYGVALTLASLYFGKATRAEIQKFAGKDPWSSKPSERERLGEIMAKEISSFQD